MHGRPNGPAALLLAIGKRRGGSEPASMQDDDGGGEEEGYARHGLRACMRDLFRAVDDKDEAGAADALRSAVHLVLEEDDGGEVKESRHPAPAHRGALSRHPRAGSGY